MNPDPQAEKRIFAEALRFTTPEQRAEFLANACGGDLQLRQRIEALLEAHEQASEFLNAPAPGVSSKTLLITTGMIPITEKPGDKIGRYKLREQIGEGGCGVVYVADQEEPVRRRVALKVIKLGMDTKQVVARFEAERQALALMDHPHIAKVLDAGATNTGRPYFVMELVRGIKITDYCDKNNLSTEERLRLFIQVCSAIQHAHQKGIIHRDIKPSNILVTLHDGVPVPKVIDFGIAKATSDQRLTDKTVYTAFEQFIGTPAYMSPEQAEMSGLDIDTRSDICSLGVLLYELLTGRPPFDAQELMAAGLDAMRRTIREQEPPKPSTRLTQELVAAPRQSAADSAENGGALPRRRYVQLKELIALVRGDLDWIVMKALEKDRVRRYETANGFAQDILRHLDSEPVVARPPSAVYRFRKLVRRNKFAFTAASTVAVTLVVGLCVSTLLFLKEKTSRQRATVAEQAQASLRVQAEKMADQSRNRLVALHTANGLRLIENGDVAGSLPFLAEAVKLKKPSSNNAAIALFRLRTALDQWPRLVQTIPVEEGADHAEFSPDGLRLLTAATEGWGYKSGARVWDVFTGKPITPMLRQGEAIGSACFSPDGKRIAIGGTDGITRIWDAITGNPVSPPIQQSCDVQDVSFSSDGRNILTAIASYGTNRYGEAKLWDAATSEPLSPPLRHSSVVHHASLSPDGQRILTVSEDEAVCIWDFKTGEKTTLGLELGNRNHYAAFSPDGKCVAVAGWGNNDRDGVRVFSASTGEPTTPLLKHFSMGLFVEFSPDGRRLVSASKDWTA